MRPCGLGPPTRSDDLDYALCLRVGLDALQCPRLPSPRVGHQATVLRRLYRPLDFDDPAAPSTCPPDEVFDDTDEAEVVGTPKDVDCIPLAIRCNDRHSSGHDETLSRLTGVCTRSAPKEHSRESKREGHQTDPDADLDDPEYSNSTQGFLIRTRVRVDPE